VQESHASLTPRWESSGHAPRLSAWIRVMRDALVPRLVGPSRTGV